MSRELRAATATAVQVELPRLRAGQAGARRDRSRERRAVAPSRYEIDVWSLQAERVTLGLDRKRRVVVEAQAQDAHAVLLAHFGVDDREPSQELELSVDNHTTKCACEAGRLDDAALDVVYNLPQQDILTLLVRFRAAFAVANPIRRPVVGAGTPYLFAVLTKAAAYRSSSHRGRARPGSSGA